MGDTSDPTAVAVDADGVEIENSPFYHFYVLSAVEQDSHWMQTYGISVPAGFEDQLGRMFDYAAYCPMPNGYVPLLGASVTLNVRKLLPKVYDESVLDEDDDIEGFDNATPEFTYIRTTGAQGRRPRSSTKRLLSRRDSRFCEVLLARPVPLGTPRG